MTRLMLTDLRKRLSLEDVEHIVSGYMSDFGTSVEVDLGEAGYHTAHLDQAPFIEDILAELLSVAKECNCE